MINMENYRPLIGPLTRNRYTTDPVFEGLGTKELLNIRHKLNRAAALLRSELRQTTRHLTRTEVLCQYPPHVVEDLVRRANR